MNSLLNLIDHIAWADAQVLAAIASIDVARRERAQAMRLYAHLAGASQHCRTNFHRRGDCPFRRP